MNSQFDVNSGGHRRENSDFQDPSPLGSGRSGTVKRSQSVDARGSSFQRELLRDAQESSSQSETPKDWSKRRLSQPIVLKYHPPSGTFEPAEERVVEAEEPSEEQSSRAERVRERRTKRTTKHIGQFLRLNIQLSTGLTFDVTVDKSHTIEYLAHQIEAEYAFRNILYSLGQTERDEVDPHQKAFEPLEIGQLFDAGMLALAFSDVIGDALSFNDTVLVINTYGAPGRAKNGGRPPIDLDVEDPAAFDTKTQGVASSMMSMSEIQEDGKASAMRARQISLTTSTQTLDDRLQVLLHNKIGLTFFHQFCIEEYCVENVLFWLAVEVLQSCDASIRPNLAKFIYLVYIAPSAPLVINVSPEIRNDIKDMFSGSSQAILDISIFDEAQENVYAVLKGHSFVRFEKSALNDIYVVRKRQERAQYIDSKITGSYAESFPLHADKIGQLIAVLDDPSSNTSSEALAKLTDGKRFAVNSSEFRELILSLCSRDYFQEPEDAFSQYFDAVTRMSWAQKQKKMLKEKKLAKFFGQRPSNEQLQKQNTNQRRISMSIIREMKRRVDGDELDNLLAELLSDSTDDQSGSAGDPTARRRKMEKLETFFGNKIPNKQKVEQSLVMPNDEVNLVFSTENSDDESEGLDVITLENITTTNDLQPEQRRMLNKRNKKLSTLLGENLDAKTISKVVNETVNTTRTVLPTMEAGNISRRVSVAEHYKEACDDSEEEFNDEDAGILNPTGTIVKKKRLDKLSSMLGERIKVNDVSDREAAVTNPINIGIGRALPAPRLLTPDERKQVQKRANKIERLMGALPPTEALITTISESEKELSSDTAKNLQKGIASISFFIQNTSDVVDLLETLSVVSVDLTNPDAMSALRRESFSNASEDGDAQDSVKEFRQRRIKKLRKFFGNEINVASLIEKQLLHDIEQTLEEVADQEERELLKANMKTLRIMVSRRSYELEADLKKTYEAPDNVYITTTSPDSSTASDIYTPRSTKPLIKSPTMTEIKDASTKEIPVVLDEQSRRASVARREVWE